LAEEPDLSGMTIMCANDEITFTLTTEKMLIERFYSRQYLAAISFSDNSKGSYIIVNQDAIHTRCEVGWSMGFALDGYRSFTYSDIGYNPCREVYKRAFLCGPNHERAEMKCTVQIK
jgi:hypothetical protein